MNKMYKFKVVFMIRHINDLDFSLPIILNACDPIVIFYEPIDKFDQRVKIILNETKYVFFYEDNYFLLFYIYFNKIFKFLLKIIGLKNLAVKINSHISNIEVFWSLKCFKKIFEKIRSERIISFVFDHTVTPKTLKTIEYVKNNLNESINIYSIPHGVNIFANKMLDKHNLFPPVIELGYENYSLVVCGDNQQYEKNNHNKIFIENLRYTHFWVEKLLLMYGLNKKTPCKAKNEKIKIIILLSKFIGNINIDEVYRCIKILDRLNNLEIKVKPHPRGIEEVKLIKKNFQNIEITENNTLECINWSDCLIIFQTSSVFDAFLLKKPVIFPSYVTSNKLINEVLINCNVAETPDEFYYIVKKLADGENLQLPDFSAPSWKNNLVMWRNILNTESKY